MTASLVAAGSNKRATASINQASALLAVQKPMFEAERARVPQTSDIAEAVISIGRVANLDEVRNSIVYLCGPAASQVSGIEFITDSGGTLTVYLIGVTWE